MRQRPPDTALSRRCLLRLIGGAATLQIPTFGLAGFDFFLSEYSATRAELQAEMARRFPLQQRYAELAKSVLVTRGGSVLIETRPD